MPYHWAFWQARLMWIGMIVFWGLLIWAVYALVISARRQPRDRDDCGSARKIVDERLARSEIDEAEYHRLRELLDSGTSREPTAAEPRASGSARNCSNVSCR
jgi:putative membrane protein